MQLWAWKATATDAYTINDFNFNTMFLLLHQLYTHTRTYGTPPIQLSHFSINNVQFENEIVISGSRYSSSLYASSLYASLGGGGGRGLLGTKKK